ncbi:Hypp6717 [Branchiostoma lanceolatum]|uniref:Hypp6717 protein n=1 Tax=Branchiostoma lanceolatum TaxID=7740 RepID=A0A8J9YVE0_BRALA|nr:Hypp6717 [Branchiostoma lanceolatum]
MDTTATASTSTPATTDPDDFVAVNEFEGFDDFEGFDPQNITPYNYEPRRSARLAEETGEGGSDAEGAAIPDAVPVAPPEDPSLIEA